ncbi:MAG: DNA methyltransferase [Candidatus Hodarchaeales archaeon]
MKNLADKQKGNQEHLIVNTDSLFLYKMSDSSCFNRPVKKVKRKNGLLKEIADPWDNIWLDIPGYQKTKKTLYPTENSESLLERVIQLCSEKGDIVADFFAGSGTTLAVAENLDRCWIGADIGDFSIHEIRKRILRNEQKHSFVIYTCSKNMIKPVDIQVELQVQFNRDKRAITRFITGECYLRGKFKQIDQGKPQVVISCRVDESSLLLELRQYTITTNEQENGVLVSNDPGLTDLIDFWAVDWEYNGDYFQGMWFSSRNFIRRKISSKIETVAFYSGNNKKNKCLMVQIVDITGNLVKVIFTINTQYKKMMVLCEDL